MLQIPSYVSINVQQRANDDQFIECLTCFEAKLWENLHFPGSFFVFLNLFMYWQLGKFLGMAATSIGTAWAEHPRPIGLVDNIYFFIAQGPPKDVWSKKRQISKRQTPVRLLSLPRQALTLRSRQTGGQLHKQSYVTHTFSSRGLSWCCTWQTCFQFFFKKQSWHNFGHGHGLGMGMQ